MDWRPTIVRIEGADGADPAFSCELDLADHGDGNTLDSEEGYDPQTVMGVIGETERKGSDVSNTCQDCGKVYRHRRHLQRHMKYECGSKKARFKCPVCLQTFIRPEHLKRHGMSIHHMKISTPRQ